MNLNEEIKPSAALQNVTACAAQARLNMEENEVLRMSLRALGAAIAELEELKTEDTSES